MQNAQYYEQPELWPAGSSVSAKDEERLRLTIKAIPLGVESLLDVGCGPGVFLSRLVERGSIPRVVGADFAEQPLRLVRVASTRPDICRLHLRTVRLTW